MLSRKKPTKHTTFYALSYLASTTVFPFFSFLFPRAFEDEGKARLGLVECAKHELLQPFNVLHEKEGECRIEEVGCKTLNM